MRGLSCGDLRFVCGHIFSLQVCEDIRDLEDLLICRGRGLWLIGWGLGRSKEIVDALKHLNESGMGFIGLCDVLVVFVEGSLTDMTAVPRVVLSASLESVFDGVEDFSGHGSTLSLGLRCKTEEA